jgi:hypothetical protein
MMGQTHSSPTSARIAQYSLLEALLNRRSRRFAKGMHLNGGPLAYASAQPPQPLSLEAEAALAFAGCGVTGYALAELPYESGDVPEAGSGNILIHFAARTVASGDAAHCITLFVINDDGVWMLRRPQDYPRAEIAGLAQAAREHRLVELYERSRVRIADRRLDVPREVPFTPPFNKWSANLPGTTFFLPIAELSALAINVTLLAFSEECGYYALDERNRFQPAGVAKFARSKGGHLYDDPKDGRVATVEVGEEWLLEFAAIEQGGVLQNLGLMTQALGLGGFPILRRTPFHLDANPRLSDGADPLRPYDRGRAVDDRPPAASAKEPPYADGGWSRTRRSGADQAVLPAVLPQYEGGGARFRRVQVWAGRHPPRRRRGHRLAGWRACADGHPTLLRQNDRRDDRLLRVYL